MKIAASKIRKGMLVKMHGMIVKVRKREKWNKIYIKVHFEDGGYGLPMHEGLFAHRYEFEVLGRA